MTYLFFAVAIALLFAQMMVMVELRELRKMVDFSKEDSKLEKATEDAKAELRKISQKN